MQHAKECEKCIQNLTRKYKEKNSFERNTYKGNNNNNNNVKINLNKCVMKIWIRFMWFTLGSIGGLL
jgi:hypothetical protein